MFAIAERKGIYIHKRQILRSNCDAKSHWVRMLGGIDFRLGYHDGSKSHDLCNTSPLSKFRLVLSRCHEFGIDSPTVWAIFAAQCAHENISQICRLFRVIILCTHRAI